MRTCVTPAVAVADTTPFLVLVTELVKVEGPAMVKDVKSKRIFFENQ